MITQVWNQRQNVVRERSDNRLRALRCHHFMETVKAAIRDTASVLEFIDDFRFDEAQHTGPLVRDGNVFRQHINQLETPEAQLGYVQEFFNRLMEQQVLAA